MPIVTQAPVQPYAIDVHGRQTRNIRREWIDDSRDRFKRQVFGQLAPEWGPYVIPMLSDSDVWTNSDKAAYRSSLGLNDGIPIDWANGAANSFAVSRSRIAVTGDAHRDVFLDPDTGIGNKMPALTRKAEHVYVAELELVADENPDRVLVVYQHRTRDRGFPLAKLALAEDFNRFACTSGDVALICLSRRLARLSQIKERLQRANTWALTPVLLGAQRPQVDG